MSTTTFDIRSSDTFGAAEKPAKPSFFQRMIESRMRQGRARVAVHLVAQSDQTLSDLGFTPEQIAEVRKTGKIPASFWR